jgi:hypothetical protein
LAGLGSLSGDPPDRSTAIQQLDGSESDDAFR